MVRIYKNEGAFDIIQPPDFIKSQLKYMEHAGRVCYQSCNDSKRSTEEFIRMIIKRGHTSVLEHSIVTVDFKNCSRGFTHENVRNRIGFSYSQESTRYVDYAKGEIDLDGFGLKVVCPPHKDENEIIPIQMKIDDQWHEKTLSFTEMMQIIEAFYRGLRKSGWKAEDARQTLPIGLVSEIVVSANFRSLRNMFSQRCTRPAHWEIRSVMCRLLEELRKIVPVIFEDFVYAGLDINNVPYYNVVKSEKKIKISKV